jgi:hypothetical protein
VPNHCSGQNVVKFNLPIRERRLQKFWPVLLLFSLLAANGSLNVFTGDKEAEILIDGESAGRDMVRGHSLPAGTHYLQVQKNGKIIRAQTVHIQDNKTETVALDDFVDYRSGAASRGAIEVEAMRVRETRGNLGFGVYGGSPASGLSLKWWPWERFGLQGIGYVNNFDGNRDTRLGARLLISLNESVYKNSTFTTFLALGGGRSTLVNQTDDEKNEMYDLQELALGIEFKIADFFSATERSTRYVIIKEGKENISPYITLLTEIALGLGEGLLKFGHIALELGVEHIATRYFLPAAEAKFADRTAVKASGGFHVYF